jgi:septum formation protein
MLASNKKIILASKSPRRQELIKGLEIPFEVITYEVDESFSEDLKKQEIPIYLANKKAAAFPLLLKENEILLTADTVVWVNNHVLNKPESEQECFEMLSEICNNTHEVFTGVCLKSNNKIITLFERSEVTIKLLSSNEIWHYIKNYKPFDKAGSYGIQDWFGYTAVKKINGCFYNVMGLPVSKIYDALKTF